MDMEGDIDHWDSTCGDTLTSMATEIANLRDFLVALAARNYVSVNDETVDGMEYIERGLIEMLAPRWNKCQEEMRRASDKMFEQVDSTWFDKPMPEYFRDMTANQLMEHISKSRKIRIPTNPATLISTGQVGLSGD